MLANIWGWRKIGLSVFLCSKTKRAFMKQNRADYFPNDISDFVFIPDYLNKIQELAGMSENENWSYKDENYNKENHPHPMLENYLTYTYRRLSDEKKIKINADKTAVCFNTGLLTRSNQQEIYLLMKKSFLIDKQQYWHFGKFAKSGDRELLNVFGKNLPDMCEYFTDPSVLMFDARKEIEFDYDHIIDENIDRFPDNIKKRDRYEIRNLLFAATDRIRERIKRNYKIAVPHYFHGIIQFLIPVCLTNPSKADFALVVEKVVDEDGNFFYRGTTILPLDWAYNSARQIAKPSQEWLNP